MERDDVVAKVKRLLKLSRSENIGEAANAAAAAQRLMTRYQIDAASIGDLDDDMREGVVTARDEDGLYIGINIPVWIMRLATNLADLNSCATFLQFSNTRGQKRVIGIVGSGRSVSCVRYMFEYLRAEVLRLAGIYGRAHSLRYRLKRPSTKWRNDFKMGVTDELIRRMQEARDELFAQAGQQTLMRLDSLHRSAKEWVQDHVTAKAPPQKAVKVDLTAYATGRVAGQKVQLRADVALPEET